MNVNEKPNEERTMPDELHMKLHDRMAIITLNRPQRRNALTPDLLSQLNECLRDAFANDAVDGIVLTGASPTFCAGLDLRLLTGGASDRRAVLDGLLEACAALYEATKPTVAAVNGHAVAGGAVLMSACDFVIAAEDALMGYPEIKRGIATPIVLPLLVDRVGWRRAEYLLLTGEAVSARQACDFGLVNTCVASEDCLDRAIELATCLAAMPSHGYTRTKRMLRETRRDDPIKEMRAAHAAHPDMEFDDETLGTVKKFIDG